MKILGRRPPTAEQLKIIGSTRLGVEVIRGAAGSGKTTTALLRLQNLSDMFQARHRRLQIARPVSILILTYNRTLCGYVRALAEDQTRTTDNVVAEVDTFAHWAMSKLGKIDVRGMRAPIVQRLGRERGIRLAPDFLCGEVEYVLGRFPQRSLADYLDAERTGRGSSPRVERGTRAAILDVIEALKRELADLGQLDWEDLPSHLLDIENLQYDIVIVDEAQDFSANQLRAVQRHLVKDHALTLIIDTMQRLYPRGYTWTEAGLDPTKIRFHRLQQNHRNTVQIARFAKSIVAGMKLDDDGTLPDFDSATRKGKLPVVLKGKYVPQLDYAIEHIRANVNLEKESVAFLKPQGGNWFKTLRTRLRHEHFEFFEITREKDWPEGEANIALCTMHSAKGLEFDHVIILGLNAEVTQHGEDEDDDQLDTLRRLLAMAVARARETVIVGYKPEEGSDLIDFFDDDTFEEVEL